MKGEPSPHAEAAFQKTATTRAQIIKVLAESVAYCDAAYASLDDKRAGEIVDLPFGMGKGARALPLMINWGHGAGTLRQPGEMVLPRERDGAAVVAAVKVMMRRD